MKKNINIAVVGLGNIGIYLLNEINSKRKNIELLTGKKINISAVSAKNIKKKRKFKLLSISGYDVHEDNKNNNNNFFI